MRLAVVSDIHGNRTAFQAVLADLRQTAPDLVLHAGDLVDSGSSPCHILDQVRDLGWQGVLGNTDEMLTDPASLHRFAAGLPLLKSLFDAVGEMAQASRSLLGAERLAWLRTLPRVHFHENLALLHASPATTWQAPAEDALEAGFRPLGRPLVIYGHIHRPSIRTLPGITIANSGSVGLPHDGDPRAAYLLLDDFQPLVRRVEYDVEREIQLLRHSGLPHAAWIARTLRAAAPQMP